MNNYKMLLGATALCQMVATTASSQAKKGVANDGKKNVLMIIVDDWGANDCSASGSNFYETPNFDGLKSSSVSFSNGYVSYPRSVPSRFSMLTGMHCARPQVISKSGDDRKIDQNTLCIAEPFKKGGYQTFYMGKYHLVANGLNPDDKGFDINIGGGKAGAPMSYFQPFNEARKPGGKEAPIHGMDDARPGEYLTDYMNRKMVDFIQQPHDKPFFAVCSYYAVHTPLEAKPELIQKYLDKKKKMGLMEDHYIPEEAGVRKAEQNNEVYAAMIESVDQGIGMIIQALKEQGLYENTHIVMISDHGGLSNRGKNLRELATTNAPFKAGKGHLYEGGIRVPFIIHSAGQEKGRVSDVPVVSYDILPTLADLCGLNIPDNAIIDGSSLHGLLQNKPAGELAKRKLFWHKVSERPGQTGDYLSTAMRDGDYKLIYFYKQDRVELYNLANDPGETKNLADEQPERVKMMLSQMNDWKQQIGTYGPVEKEPATQKKGQKNGQKKGKG